MTRQGSIWLMAFCFLFCFAVPAAAEDSEQARSTLIGLQGVQVIVEELQPNILKQEKYLQIAGLSKTQLQKDTKYRLKAAGIKVLSPDEWLKTLGRPVLYLNVNTHESEKYWFAYDIKVELRQLVALDARPEIKMLANTWGINMTGVVNIGTFNVVRDNAGLLVERFVQAYKTVSSNGQLIERNKNYEERNKNYEKGYREYIDYNRIASLCR